MSAGSKKSVQTRPGHSGILYCSRLKMARLLHWPSKPEAQASKVFMYSRLRVGLRSFSVASGIIQCGKRAAFCQTTRPMQSPALC